MSARRGLCALVLGTALLFGLQAHGYVENTDAEITMHSARALWLRGDPGMLTAGDDVSLAERTIAERVHAGRFLGMTGRNGKAYTCFSVGHQVLMLPCVALGEALRRLAPAPEEALAHSRPALHAEFFWTRFLVSLLGPLAAAGTFGALLHLATLLGRGRGEALLVAATAMFATQAWPAASETLSDGPGGFFLIAAVTAGVHWARRRQPRALLVAGACAGAAVSVRYPHAAPVAVWCAWVAVVAWRQGRVRDCGWLVAGGAPFAALLALANWLRFGDALEFGYVEADTAWWSYPPYLGVPLALLSPGKGVLWFSLPLWLALAEVVRRRLRGRMLALAFSLWILPILIVGHTHGWHGSQCWGVRYATPGTVLLVAVALAVGRPWRRRPRCFAAVCAAGVLVSLGGVLTPYRGFYHVAHHAAEVVYRADIDSGAIAPGTLHDHYMTHPRFSPIVGHWRYAWQALRGRLGPGPASANIDAVLGIDAAAAPALPDFPREDLGFRHFWLAYLHDLVGVPWRAILAAWLAGAAACLWLGAAWWRRA